MKKKFLSLLLAICMIIPCAFTLTACGKCEHNWILRERPTLNTVGTLWCNKDCNETKEIPTLNETDYIADVSNPDYKTYIYNIDGKSFNFFNSNFNCQWSADGLRIVEYTGNSANIVIPDIMAWYEEG